MCRFLLRTFPRWWTSWHCQADVRRCDDADPEEELFFSVQEKQEQQLVSCGQPLHIGELNNRVSDRSMSALFVIDYVRRNDDEVRGLQGGM